MKIVELDTSSVDPVRERIAAKINKQVRKSRALGIEARTIGLMLSPREARLLIRSLENKPDPTGELQKHGREVAMSLRNAMKSMKAPIK